MLRGIAPAALLIFVLPLVSVAESLRVAVARGEALTLRGEELVLRTEEGGHALRVGPEIRLDAVGPFVSEGSRLAERMFVSSAQATPLKVGGFEVLGELEIVAGDDGRLVAVDRIDLETYVASVVGGEMPASWPAAALQAQAVAARTYALRKARSAAKDAVAQLEASVLHQVYKGAGSLDPRTRAAAESTRGMVLAWEDDLAETFFFSSCRRSTESVTAAFGRTSPTPYLQPVACVGMEGASNRIWTRRIAVAELDSQLRAAGAIGDRLAAIEVVSRTPTQRVASARLKTRHGGRNVTGAELRRLVGYQKLPSLDFSVRLDGSALVFEGGGSGHGVGLCQWCARGMAAEGASFEAILGHFYPGAELRRWVGRDPQGGVRLAALR